MLKNIQNFIALTYEEKKLFIEAYVTLHLIRGVLSFVPFKKISKNLKHYSKTTYIKPSTKHQMKYARKIAMAIKQVSGHSIGTSTCMAQTLTAQKMLDKRGIIGKLFIGVQKDKDTIKAHAWLSCNNDVIVGKDVHNYYKEIVIYSWGNVNNGV